MSEHLRDRLHQEMSGELPAPDHDLVAGAVANGLRARRVRRTASGAGTFAVVGLTVLAVTLGSQLGTDPKSSSVSVQAGGGVTTAPVTQVAPAPVTAKAIRPTAVASAAGSTPTTAGTASGKEAAAQDWRARQKAASAANPPEWTGDPTGVAATPQGELQLFSEVAAPYGVAGHFAVSQDADKTHVKAHLTRADGKVGMLDFSMYHDTLGYAGDCVDGGPNSMTCHPTDDGGYVILADDHAGCVNTADITVVHPDGTAVLIFLASCLTDATNQITPGTQTLSVAQAEKIFQDPRFDFTMPADVVDRGEQNLGNLATFW